MLLSPLTNSPQQNRVKDSKDFQICERSEPPKISLGKTQKTWFDA